MDLDVRTIAALSAVLSVLTAVALAAVIRDFPRESRAELRYWTLGVGLLAMGWAVFALRGPGVPEWVPVVVGNLLLFLGVQMQLFALRAFLRLRVFRARDLAGPLLQLTVSTVFLWLLPSLTARVVLGALLFAAVLAESARTLWVHAPRPQPMAYHVVGVSLVVMAVIVLGRAAVQMSPAGVTEVMQPSPMQGLVFTMSNMAPLVATLGFLLIINERLQRELHRLAIADPLTGLANRRELERHAGALLAEPGMALGVIAIDADHFKRINDTRGHAVGDSVLVALAERLRHAARPGDVVGRLGGEEFVMLLPRVDPAAAADRAERIRTAIAEVPVALGEGGLAVTASIGVAVGEGDEALPALLRRADQAMYAAKAAGRNRVVVAH